MSATTTTPTTTEQSSNGSRRWWALIVIALAQLMIVLDITIVNIALPSIQRDLDVSAANRQWVVTAYTLAFGGLLLLGGRVADYVGRKRTFLLALAGFAAASVVGGASVNLEMLLTARAAQGAFGALLAPTALSLLSTTFPNPRERGTAFAVFGAVVGSGSAVGLTLGGVLTEYLSWHWVLYVNAPIAVVTGIAAVFLLTESRIREHARFDLLGAVLATAGLVALVYGFSEAASNGWDASLTIGMVAAGAGLLVLFVIAEAQVPNPLLPLRILANRGRGGAYLAVLLAMVGMFGMVFFLSFYLQGVRDYTPLEAGVAFLPMTGGVLLASTLVSRLMARIPPRLLLGIGLLLGAGGLTWLTQLEVGSDYAGHVLPTLLAVGFGMGMIFPTAANLATFRVAAQESGVASATLNTAQQVGASLGTALLNTIAANQTADYLASHQPSPGVRLTAQVDGYTLATTWGAGIMAAAGVIVLFLVKARLGSEQPESAPASSRRRGHRAAPGLAPSGSGNGQSAGRSTDGPPTGSESDSGRFAASLQLSNNGSTFTDGSRPTLDGRIVDERGDPVDGAVLTVVDGAGQHVGHTRTDGWGGYRIDVPEPGRYVVIAAAAEFHPHARELTLGTDPASADMVLTEHVSVHGLVRSVDGRAIAGAVVTLTDGDGAVVACGRTDRGGGYALSTSTEEGHTLVVTAEGYRPAAQSVGGTGSDQQRIEVAMQPGGGLHGGVTSVRDGRPLGDIRITVQDDEGELVAAAETDEAGRYRIEGVAEGEYTVVATGYAPVTTRLRLARGQDGQHDIQLGHTTDVSPD